MSQEKAMYGYQTSGMIKDGVRRVQIVHLMKGDKPYCGAYLPLTLTDFGMGKPRCRGCVSMKRREEKRIEKELRRKAEAEHSASMF